MRAVNPQKSFAQHFLKDENVLDSIIDILKQTDKGWNVLEIGPGMGALTGRLLDYCGDRLKCIEVDRRCVEYLENKYPQLQGRIIYGDFLQVNLREVISEPTLVIGNFPYNISTQIIWRAIENHERIPVVIGMFQKEVADRLVAGKGSKVYGIQSVINALYYTGKKLFDIPPQAFDPPPKVTSSVIILEHVEKVREDVDPVVLKKIVKAAFNQRRKMLRNSLSGVIPAEKLISKDFEKRPEQLSLDDFIEISNLSVI